MRADPYRAVGLAEITLLQDADTDAERSNPWCVDANAEHSGLKGILKVSKNIQEHSNAMENQIRRGLHGMIAPQRMLFCNADANAEQRGPGW